MRYGHQTFQRSGHPLSWGFRVETCSVGGKMKKRRCQLIEGQVVEDFIRQNADDVFLKQEGYFEIIHQRATEQNRG